MFGAETPDALSIFISEYVKHFDQPDAGVIAVTRAGLRDPAWPPSIMAERYLAMPEIQTAIQAAQKFYKPVERKDVSQQTITDDLENVFQKAMDKDQYQAAIAAKKLQAELHSLLKQTIEHNHSVTVKTVSDAQLEKIASKAMIDGDFKDVTPSTNVPAANNP